MRNWFSLVVILACTIFFSVNINAQPHLIPMPIDAKWSKGSFILPKTGFIRISDKNLEAVANQFAKTLSSAGFNYKIDAGKSKSSSITISLTPTTFTKNRAEAYSLTVNSAGIKIKANEPHGVFNALQTLKQLINKNKIPYCNITDEPAYQWRGYMVDVGRNYQPVALLKQQIDAMALAKLNVFHFHATEHVAWRFESKKYPQLNAPEAMTRDKGKFYSEAELKDIIQYCKDRYIEFVPEIDMPGHSDAFTRAMGFTMQTPQGLAAVKELVKEFCDTYDIKYLHLGADEVKITMPEFVPEMVNFVKGLNKEIVAWWPGRIHETSIIRNVWFGDAGEKTATQHVRTVDSRHTYINHMDPLESVVTLFFRQYNGVTTGDNDNLGATVCAWPDRRINTPEDAVRANAVYPALLAFSERIWRGGGITGFISSIPTDATSLKEFTNFENRLLSIRDRFFKNQIFTYTKQADIKWELFGPFDNNGHANALFPIENNFTNYKAVPFETVYGGTIVLRHFWSPTIDGFLKDPKENSTIYARTKIWSATNRTGKFWISFNDLSRSPATDSPPVGKWNFNNGQVWVNNELILPPHWKRGGEKGNAEIPLTDENYAYREPTPVKLKKGWNEVWMKVPVTTFRGKDWQNPVKWMFTFAEVK